MTGGKTIEERRQYIDQVRASFGSNQPQKNDMEMDIEEQSNIGLGFFKLKLFLAFVLFVSFIYCDHFKIEVYNIKTTDIIKEIESTIPVENVIQTFKNMV